MRDYTPKKVSEITGVAEKAIVDVAKAYGTTRPAMIVSGGGTNHWSGATSRSARSTAGVADRQRGQERRRRSITISASGSRWRRPACWRCPSR